MKKFNIINLEYDNPISNALNIQYEKLLYNKDKYLDKNNHYKIICKKGKLSKKVSNILNAYGFKTTFDTK